MTKLEEKIILDEVKKYILNKLKNINQSQPYAETLYYYTQSLMNIEKIKNVDGNQND